MEKTIYMAPMEGITDTIFRTTFAQFYGGIDKYFTPFLSPNSTHKFTTREKRELDTTLNNVSNTIPQLLTNNPEHFLWAAKEINNLGYSHININLGCPSPTVVTKKKGSGLLYYPNQLSDFLYEIFDKCEKISPDLKISIKTRLGLEDKNEFFQILDIYNQFPIYELIIHPRIQKDFYKAPVSSDMFSYATTHTSIPLIYNGELWTLDDVASCYEAFPEISGIMIGRGLLRSPQFPAAINNTCDANPTSTNSLSFDTKKFIAFHDELWARYSEILSGDTPILFRMKEFWAHWGVNFNDEKLLKKLKKSKSVAEYKSIINSLR